MAMFMEFDLDINGSLIIIIMVSIAMVVIINQDIIGTQVELVVIVMGQVIYLELADHKNNLNTGYVGICCWVGLAGLEV